MREKKGEIADSLASSVWSAASPKLWAEYISYCFAARAQIGDKERILNYDSAQPTEGLKLCLKDYVKICRSGYGRVFVVHGAFGSGKSQALLTLARGSSPWHPLRSIFVNVGTSASNGNQYFDALSNALYFNNNETPDRLAWGLVNTALSPSLTQTTVDALGCCDGKETVEEGKLIKILPNLDGFEDQVDKKPAIVLDNIKFVFRKGDELTDEKHAQFYTFINALFEAAYGNNVVVFLGVPNRFLAEKLVVLNGGTKIVPASVSKGEDRLAEGCWLQDEKCEDDNSKVSVVWRSTFAWTANGMRKFLNRRFRGAVDEEIIAEAARKFGDMGALRFAIEHIEESYPTLADSATVDSQDDK